eukprot:3370079-Rhodomonas_salina.9
MLDGMRCAELRDLSAPKPTSVSSRNSGRQSAKHRTQNDTGIVPVVWRSEGERARRSDRERRRAVQSWRLRPTLRAGELEGDGRRENWRCSALRQRPRLFAAVFASVLGVAKQMRAARW